MIIGRERYEGGFGVEIGLGLYEGGSCGSWEEVI